MPAEYIHRYVGQGTAEQSKTGKLLTEERIKGAATKRRQNELDLAKDRDQVIYKDLVKKQAYYLLMNLRQKILNIPLTYARKLTELTDVNKVQELLREMSLSILQEVRDLPNTVTDPDWLLKLEKKEQEN